MLVVSGVSPCLVVVDERRNLMSWFSLPAFWWWARVLGPMAACEAEDFAVGGDGIKRGGECEWDARDTTMLVGDGLRMSGRVDGCDGEEAEFCANGWCESKSRAVIPTSIKRTSVGSRLCHGSPRLSLGYTEEAIRDSGLWSQRSALSSRVWSSTIVVD